MRRYPEYKASGVEWIGEIPTYWHLKRLKYVMDLNMGQSPPSEDYSNNQLGTPFLQGCAEFGQHHPTPRIYCETANKRARRGDILLSVRAPVGEINIAESKIRDWPWFMCDTSSNGPARTPLCKIFARCRAYAARCCCDREHFQRCSSISGF